MPEGVHVASFHDLPMLYTACDPAAATLLSSLPLFCYSFVPGSGMTLDGLSTVVLEHDSVLLSTQDAQLWVLTLRAEGENVEGMTMEALYTDVKHGSILTSN